jgi:predicted solute-binding protein
MNKYKKKKEAIIKEAIETQIRINESNLSYGELAEIQNSFYKKAKQYGLIKEFKREMII